jgi:hypothetical protein
VLARRRLAAEAQRQAGQRAQSGEDAGVAAYVHDHPELANQTPDQQRAAWQAARTQRAGGAQAPSEDEGSYLVQLSQLTESFVAPATDPAAGGSGTPRPAPTVTPADRAAARQHLQQVAEGRFTAHQRRRVKAKCTCIGLPLLRRAQVVQVVGTAVRDGGLWYVSGCIHKIGDEGYETELELTREGVNGRSGQRSAPAARPNPTAPASAGGAGTPTAEPPVRVNLANGREV